MKSYEEIKTWCNDNKNSLVVGFCMVLVFVVGFGTGSYNKKSVSNQAQSASQQQYYNKNTQTAPKAQAEAADTAGAGETQAQSQVLAASTTADCLIKGNISSKGEKIYHVPGGSSYKIVKPEQCFNTEKEALDAGFRKALR